MDRGDKLADLTEVPIYGPAEAAQYLRVPYNTLLYWLKGSEFVPPLVRPATRNPVRLSFMNLLECHMVSGMRSVYQVRVPRVRKALHTLTNYKQFKHPLVEQVFLTNGVDLLIEHLGDIIDLMHGQTVFRSMVELHLRRIERDPTGLFKFFPFVIERRATEPRSIEITPSVGFGKPVIAGTGISTAVIASRFNARESVEELAGEYGRAIQEIEEAIRWEQKSAAIAA